MNKEFENNLDYDVVGEKFFMFGDKNSTNRTLDRAFAISNEQLPDIFEKLNLTGKKVATVGSSGDQTLNAILQGCKDITIIDGNPYAKAFMEYKLAMIKTFDFQTFNELFAKPQMFNWRIYAKISHHLSPDTRQFWDTLMLEQNEMEKHEFPTEKSISNKMLIIDHRDKLSLFYRDEENYKELQSILNSNTVNFKYISAEFLEFPEALKEKYDLIYLSNIYFYIKPEDFTIVANKLYNYRLNNGGKMIANYEFDSPLQNAPKKLGKHKLELEEVTRRIHGEEIKDTVWIINKDKQTQKDTNLGRE